MHQNNPRSFRAQYSRQHTNIQNLPTNKHVDMNIVWQVSVLLKTNKTTLESVKAFMKEPHPQLS